MVGYGPFDSNLGVYRMNMGFSRLLRHPMKKRSRIEQSQT